MKISAKSRYALHLMLELAMQDEGDNLSVKSVAESRGISEKYLEQVIPVLVRTGLVRSVRGAKGGYHLMKSPEDITVGTILRTVSAEVLASSLLALGMVMCSFRSSETYVPTTKHTAREMKNYQILTPAGSYKSHRRKSPRLRA